MPNTTTSKERFQKETIAIIDKLLLLGCILGAFIVGVSIFSAGSENKVVDLFSDFASLVIMLSIYFTKNWLPNTVRVYIINSMIFGFVIIDLYQYGMLASDKNFIIIIPFLAILFLSAKHTIIISSIVFSVYLTIGYLISTNTIVPIYQDNTTHFAFVDWIDSTLVLGLISFVIALFVNRFYTTMFHLFHDLEDKNKSHIDREYLLTRITNNIPRTHISVYDKNLHLKFAGGHNLFKNDLLSRSGNLDFLTDELNQNKRLEIISSFKKALVGEPQSGQEKINGEYFSFKMVPLFDQNGEINSVLSVSENVTDKVKSDLLIQENLEEKNVLLAEIHHRVKNNLAVVSALLELQAYKLSDPETKFLLRKSTNRILSIAKVHELLYESQNFNKLPFDKYINQLSQIILSSMNSENLNIEIETDILIKNININHGVPLGIIFNELITNSVKYAFSGRNDNRINIFVRPEGTNIQVIYQDNGPGISDFKSQKTTSLGFTLIEQLLAQIDAVHEFDTDEHFKLTFSFPAVSDK